MTLSHSPNIVRDGLVLYLDAANPKSYPGSGTTWTDLSDNGNNGTLLNGVGYDSDNQGSMVFDGINDHIRILSYDWGNVGQDITVLSFVRREGLAQDSGQYQSIFNSTNDAGLLNFSFFVANGKLGGWVANGSGIFNYNTNYAIQLSQWYQVGFRLYNGSSFTIDTFVNGEPVSTHNGTGVRFEGTNVNTIGCFANRNQYEWNGKISVSQVYNRSLSNSQIKQNFNALRGRYGI